MHRRAGARDAECVGYLLLRDEWILFDKLQYLPFPLCHKGSLLNNYLFYKHMFIIKSFTALVNK